MHRITYDPEKFQLTIARLSKHGETVEVVVDPDEAFRLRGGNEVDLADIIKSDHVFADAQKGELASPMALEKIFGDVSNDDILDTIVRKGEIHFTAKFLKEKREDKLKQIIAHIHEGGADPKTGLPHPPARIEGALEHIKFNVDPFGSTDKQVDDIVKKLKPILPISFEKKKIQAIVPASYAAKVHGRLLSFGKKINEQWLGNGSLLYVCEVSAGKYEQLISFLQEHTHGSTEIEDIS